MIANYLAQSMILDAERSTKNKVVRTVNYLEIELGMVINIYPIEIVVHISSPVRGLGIVFE
jgi:hypothetical protein